MTTIDTARLRALAEKATPGKRAVAGSRILVDNMLGAQTWGPNWSNDQAFIAAADPQTVLALLDEIERLRGEGEWEYAKQYTDEGGNPREPRRVPGEDDLRRPDGHRADGTPYWNFTAVRRRKGTADPWEPVEGDGDA